MKKLILLLTALLPLCVFAQIKIGNTVYSTLDAAGEAATEDGDTITIAGPITLEATYGFKKDKLVIMGITPDAQIKFGAEARMGFEQNKTIIIRDLTIIGTPRRQRQMWVSDACHAIFINDTIRDCYNQGGDEHGGAFLLVGTSTTELRNCYVANNKSNKNGGVFWIVDQANVVLRNSVFVNNYAQYMDQDGKGSVIAINGSHPNCYAENCAFINNTSDGHGGVAWIEGATNMNFVNCTFSGNHAGGNSGTIGFWENGTAGLINCTVTQNTCGGNGGATFFPFTSNTLTISNSVITGNSRIDAITSEATADNINADGANTGYAINVNNSYYTATDLDLITENGSDNISEGLMLLEEIDLENRIYWNKIAAESSVLVALGDPALLAPYSTTDQRKAARTMGAATISAGAYDFDAEVYDSVVVINPIFPVTLNTETLDISCSDVMAIWCINEGPLADVEYDIESKNTASVDAEVDNATKTITLTNNLAEGEKDTVNVVLTGYSADIAYNQNKFVVYVSGAGGSSVSTTKTTALSIYPNPANNSLYITIDNNKTLLVSFYNLNGILVKTATVNAQENLLDISELATGGYFIKAIDNDGKVASQNFIKY